MIPSTLALDTQPLGWCHLCRCYQVSGCAARWHLQEGADAPTGRQGALTLKPLTSSPLSGLFAGLLRKPCFEETGIHETLILPD